MLAAYLGHIERDFRPFFYWFILIGLYLFVGFRFEVGCDWWGYLINFSFPIAITYGEAFATSEPGHWGLILLLHDLGAPYQYLNAVTAGLFFIGLHFLARRQPDPLAFLALCFPILIVNMPMSAIRQGAAIGFMCLAYLAFIDRRLVGYIAWVLIGTSFHSSILVFLAFAPFVISPVDRKHVIYATILAVPGLYLLSLTDAAELANTRYIESDIEASGAIYRISILLLSGLFFQLILAPNWRRNFSEDYRLATLGAWAMVGIIPLIFISSVIADRFSYYLIPIQVMIFARIPYLDLKKNRQLYAVLPYIFLTVIFVVWTQFSWHFNQCYLPYKIDFGFSAPL